MSWLKKITKTIFPSNDKQNLPKAPNVMASSSPWYCDAPIQRSLVVQRILQDVLKKKPELKTIDLTSIINNAIIGNDLGGYRGYFLLWHKGYVQDVYNEAFYKYVERHRKNMDFFISIVFLRIWFKKYLKLKLKK